MKKNKLLLLTVILASAAQSTLFAQIQTGVWRSNPSGTDYHHFTRSGVGAAVYINQVSTLPNHSILRLSSGTETANQNVKLTVENNGNVGIGVTSPTHKLQVNGSAKWNGRSSSYTEINSNGTGPFLQQYANDGTTLSWLIRGFASGGVQAMFNQGGINVNGTVTAKELNVTVNGWPDYVFSDTYSRISLDSLRHYIEENKHLPGIPDASEVMEKGVNLGEINIKLLEKIEELTLYILDLKNEIDSLKSSK